MIYRKIFTVLFQTIYNFFYSYAPRCTFCEQQHVGRSEEKHNRPSLKVMMHEMKNSSQNLKQNLHKFKSIYAV